MKCEHCGAKIDDDSTFCYSCGKKVEKIAAPTMEEKVENIPSQGGFSGLSIASLVTGILGMAIIPIILGIVDLIRINKGIASHRGKVFDIAGIVLGALAIVVWIIIIIVGLTVFSGFY